MANNYETRIKPNTTYSRRTAVNNDYEKRLDASYNPSWEEADLTWNDADFSWYWLNNLPDYETRIKP